MTSSQTAKASGRDIAAAIGVLIAAGLVLFFTARIIWRTLSTASPQLAQIVVGAFVASFVPVATLLIGKYIDRGREIEQELRKQKEDVYEEYMKYMSTQLLSSKPGVKRWKEEETNRFLSEFMAKLLVWGSDEVVCEFARFIRVARTIGEEGGADAPAVLLANERIVRALRRDLGHKNKDFGPYTILSIYVTDLTETFPDAEPPKAA